MASGNRNSEQRHRQQPRDDAIPDSNGSRAARADSGFGRLRRVWERLGEDDPLWAVLSDPRKRGGRWRADEFFATGKLEIETQLAAAAARGLPQARALALDFGCGVGRLTRALAPHFQRVIGIDVSASMIAAAKRLNADLGNVEFRVNPATHLSGIADSSVDFVFSHITLQHIPAPLALGYVGEFFRVLAPGGVAVFQFVNGVDASWRGRFFGNLPTLALNMLRRLVWRRGTVFEMHPMPEAELARVLLRHSGLRVLDAWDDFSAGPGWHGRRWSVTRAANVTETRRASDRNNPC